MERVAGMAFVVFAAAASAALVTYEARVLPEAAGWDRVTFLDCERSLDRGWFVQACDLGKSPGPNGEADYYQRSLADFGGGDGTFFIEWRVETDAPRALFDDSSVATALSAFGRSGTNYHFTITDTRVRLIRDNLLPIIFADIARDTPHTYRLELFGAELYVWYIDSQVVDSGIPEGPYPTNDSEMIWGTRHDIYENTARWDYIRFGRIPEDASGDFDSDIAVTLDDFYFFHECLSDARPELPGGPEGDAGPGCRFADFDFDTDTDLRDFAEFQNAFGQPQ